MAEGAAPRLLDLRDFVFPMAPSRLPSPLQTGFLKPFLRACHAHVSTPLCCDSPGGDVPFTQVSLGRSLFLTTKRGTLGFNRQTMRVSAFESTHSKTALVKLGIPSRGYWFFCVCFTSAHSPMPFSQRGGLRDEIFLPKNLFLSLIC